MNFILNLTMKKARTKLLKSYSALIVAIMALLGFAPSCDSIGPQAMYGVPSATFIVNGKVTSSETNQEIENIKIKMNRDSTKTDSEGYYQIKTGSFPSEQQTFDIEFLDIDSTENGEFQNLDTIVEFKDPHFTGGDGNWNQGETSKEFNIKLHSKK